MAPRAWPVRPDQIMANNTVVVMANYNTMALHSALRNLKKVPNVKTSEDQKKENYKKNRRKIINVDFITILVVLQIATTSKYMIEYRFLYS